MTLLETNFEEIALSTQPGNEVPGPPADDGVRLQPEMSRLNGVTVIVGSVIGCGIFVSLPGVLERTGSFNLALIVWLLSGLFSMTGAYCYAELGKMIRTTGGDYGCTKTAFGPFLAFIRLWVECIIVRPCSQAILALAFAVFILKSIYLESDPPYVSVILLATCCICFLAFINCWDVKWSTFVQDYFTYAKLLALAIIILTGVYQLATGHTYYFTFENTETDKPQIALSFYACLFAYNGWNNLNFIIEELKDPVRDLPLNRDSTLSLLGVTIVYLLANVAYCTTLSPADVLASGPVALTFTSKFNGIFTRIIAFFVAISSFGALNGSILTSSRLFYAGALEGQMPKILSMIQVSRMTPTPAVIVLALLSICYLPVTNIDLLIITIGSATWLSIGLAVCCIPYLGLTQPNKYRFNLLAIVCSIIFFLATLILTVLALIANPWQT
ncbi:hypothetical protein QYM36_013467, partial [Artemia franciscana]